LVFGRQEKGVGTRIKSKKHLSFGALREAMSSHFRSIPDGRQGSKCSYALHDVLMSAFSCMYFQDPSWAQFQKRMEQAHNRSNLSTLFDVQAIPGDTQLRDCLDTIPDEQLAPLFTDFHERLRRHKHLESFVLFPGLLLCSIDGTQYHSSKQVHCPACLRKHHRNGETTYSHAVLQGAIMHPDKKQVLPVMPEAIGNEDGDGKQDCEINAAKRFVKRLKAAHPRQGFILGGDGLMSHQPMIEAVIEQGMHYLFVAKPGDHAYLFEWLDAYPELPSREVVDSQGRIHRYRWQNAVPLHGEADACEVNFLEYQLINAAGKVTYRNSWVSDLTVTAENVTEMARAGRCRWKIENECFNTLKNQGYYIEHNYGHGQQHLSYNMYLLTLLAFFLHQIFELTDGLFQACRQRLGSKALFWESCRSVAHLLVVDSWEQLLDMLLNPDDYHVRATKKA
jgi:hypothetical protein